MSSRCRVGILSMGKIGLTQISYPEILDVACFTENRLPAELSDILTRTYQ